MTEKSTKGHMRVCRAEDGSVGREISGTGQGGDEFGTVEWDDSGARGKGIQVACGGFHTLVLTSTRYDDLSCTSSLYSKGTTPTCHNSHGN